MRGEVRLKAFTADPLSVARYGRWKPRTASSVSRSKRCGRRRIILVARLEGRGDRDAAERLKNLRLYVAREKLPQPAEDEFYHADLVGLAAVTRGRRDRRHREGRA